jgi:hypothetical protein
MSGATDRRSRLAGPCEAAAGVDGMMAWTAMPIVLELLTCLKHTCLRWERSTDGGAVLSAGISNFSLIQCKPYNMMGTTMQLPAMRKACHATTWPGKVGDMITCVWIVTSSLDHLCF